MPNTQTATIENHSSEIESHNSEVNEVTQPHLAAESTEVSTPEAPVEVGAESAVDIVEAEPTSTPEHEEEVTPAQLYIEDFVLTSLLSAGRPLTGSELESRAEGWHLPSLALNKALKKSKSVAFDDQAWEGKWRLARKGLSREERHRQPLEAMLRELMLIVGKPLPATVLAREVGIMHNIADPQLKSAVSHLLRTSRFALEIAPDVFLHQDFVFKTGAPTEELLIKENYLANDPDFQGLIRFAEIESTQPMEIARELMEFTGGPLNQKVIGFFVYRSNQKDFSSEKLAGILNDRAHFQPLKGGFISLKDHLPSLKEQTQEYLEELTNPSGPVDIEALVQQQQEIVAIEAANAPVPAFKIEPTETDLSELKRLAKTSGETLGIAEAVFQLFHLEPEDDRVTPIVESLTKALENHNEWLTVGNGNFILRENLPAGVNDIPEALKPVVNEAENPASGRAYDFELEDAGLEGSTVNWVHSPYWEDIFEENEVSDTPTNNTTAKLTLLNHHFRSRTVRLRPSDEAIFKFEGPIASMIIVDKNENESFEVWVSRETGLIYGLGLWFEENLPPSGGIIQFTREDEHVNISYGGPDSASFLTERRVEELETFLETASRISLFQLVCELLNNSKGGMELPALYASINVLRRTTKRQLASILSGYTCFDLKPRAQKSFWQLNGELKDAAATFNAEKLPFIRS
jgi:hypothetical protein